ncbi:MAG: pyridoxamine kinase [Clostridiales bacterium]|nr:pyridoxamine kinase [Clostridiales bacterium]
MRVLAINDVSCLGKCSLTVAQPIISACGITCNVLPTALLSTHTGGFTGYTFRDLTEDIPSILAHWKTLNIQFDYIYSGYLGSIEQIDLVLLIIREFLSENGTVVVDPVMGDNGTLYSGFTKAYVEKMRSLCRRADFILPNETEACYLSEVPYPLTPKTAEETLRKLQTLCPHPIVTGVMEKNTVSVYYTEDNTIRSYTHENVEGFFCGAGDVFASAFVGCLARGKSPTESIRLSSDFVTNAIRRSAIEVTDKRYGLNFEKELYPFLQKLNEDTVTV